MSDSLKFVHSRRLICQDENKTDCRTYTQTQVFVNNVLALTAVKNFQNDDFIAFSF